MEKCKSGFLESFGRSVDDAFRDAKDDIQNGLDRIRRGGYEFFGGDESNFSSETALTEVDAMHQLKKILMSRLEDIAVPVGENFSYSTILRWVKDNHIGNQFYMIKYRNAQSKNIYLFVFFAKDDDLMCGKDHPMVCYISKVLPESIYDLFNGKDVFIQKFE